MRFLDVETRGEAAGAMLLLAIAFVLWPLVAAFVVLSMVLPWSKLERARVAEVAAKMILVTAAWCGCVLAGA